ncbi:MAG: NAD-dependent epimerase/dehydratase family protein [candidate division KSB1 bacterium]|nr:NAD-dependent epimerase/dehydratase family protein [candidate division KSB1 bacterium]
MAALDDKRILITGGAGFIGSHLVDALLNEPVREIVIFDNFVRGRYENIQHALIDRRVNLIEADITDLAELTKAIASADLVVHLAALWLLECIEKPAEALQVNVTGTFNVADACRKAGVQKLIFASSASVYGNAHSTPMNEAHPLMNRTFYGATKIAGEQILKAFNEMYGLNYLALRFFNVYGPRQDYRGAYTSVIMKILDSIDRNEPPLIYGDGSQAYDFIYVKDVAQAIIRALKADVCDEAINVATGIKTSINELTELLLGLTGSPVKPRYKSASQIFVTDRVGCTEKAQNLLQFKATVSLVDGLQELIQWRTADKLKINREVEQLQEDVLA